MSALMEHLGQLESSGLIRLVQLEPELEYLFRQPLLQEAAYTSMLRVRQRQWHLIVGEALEQIYPQRLASGDLAPRLAYHFQRAGDRERALKYLTQAADTALASFANPEAETLYRQALALGPSETERAEFLFGLGQSLFRQSRFDEAIQTWREGIGLCQARGDTEKMARLYARSARAAWYADVSQSLKLCQEGLAALDLADLQDTAADVPHGPDVARLVHEAARAYFFNGMPDQAIPLCQQALEMAERLGVVDVQADALATLGMLFDETPEVALEALTRAVMLAESTGLLYQAARAHTNLAYLLYTFMADFRAAREHDLRGAALSRQRGSVAGELLGLGNAAHLSLLLGEFDQVEATLAELRALQSQVVDPGTVTVHITINRAGILRCRGELDEATRLLRACQAEARQQNNLEDLSAANTDLGSVLLERCVMETPSQTDREALLTEAEGVLREAIEISERAGWSSVQARCQWSMARALQGEMQDARRYLTETDEMAGPQPSSLDQVWLSWAGAMMATAEARWPEALAAFEQCAGICAALGMRWWWARALQAWAGAHAAKGTPSDLERARALLGEALAIFQAMGIPTYETVVEKRLEALREQGYAWALAQQRVARELAVAGRVQEGLLPEGEPEIAGWEIAATLEPARETSGDFYDFIPLPGGRLGIVVADVADKGAGAALYMALSRTLIRSHAAEYPNQPEEVLRATNQRILADSHVTLFVTLFYGILDPASGTLVYGNAGHNPPYLLARQAAETVQPLSRTGMALGILDAAAWEQASVQFEPGDHLVLYTDGIIDARDPKGTRYGDERLVDAAQAARGHPSREMQRHLLAEVHHFASGAPRFDDITLMVIGRQ